MSERKAAPPGPTRATGTDSGHRYDPSHRLTAARIQHSSPHWLLMWGTHSRRYYAYPLFTAPRASSSPHPTPTGYSVA